MNKRIKNFVIRALTNQQIKRVRKVYQNKIQKLSDEKDLNPNTAINAQFLNYWTPLGVNSIDIAYPAWYSKYSNGLYRNYVPETLYYSKIEPVLNNRLYTSSYADKNFYDLIYPEGIFPKTLFRMIDGSLLDNDFKHLERVNDLLNSSEKIILKPSVESGGGQGVEVYQKKNSKFINQNGIELVLSDLVKLYGNDLIAQEWINQHEYLAKFNRTSVNTIRLLTYRSVKTNVVHILHAILRVGGTNQVVDNSRAGGFSIGLNIKGASNNFGINKNGEKFKEINSINLSTINQHIPHWEELCSMATYIANKNIHSHLLGLDMSIDFNSKIRCLEINNTGNEINFFQLNNGPLFGKFTDEIKDYVASNLHKIYQSYRIY